VLAGCRCPRETSALASFKRREVANLADASFGEKEASLDFPSTDTLKIDHGASVLRVFRS
jgi:hypothetical protein